MGKGPANPDQLARYVENQCFWQHHLPPEQLYFKHSNAAYLRDAHAMGLVPNTNQIVLQLYCEPLQRFRLAAEGHGPVQPPDTHRARIRTYFDPLPIWYPPIADDVPELAAWPLHAVTQRPSIMYHSWGSQNAWLRQIYDRNHLYMNRRTAAAMGLADDDMVWVISRTGRVKCQLRLMEGVNPDTVWTWNAIGKRSGAWNLSADAPESRDGFLLNHVISEFRTGNDGAQWSNSDPITGQAAWYDLRVRVEKAEAGATEPRFSTLKRPPGMQPPTELLRFNAGVPAR
jgi:anaerobic selenocysteine-containing dehydrogenase